MNHDQNQFEYLNFMRVLRVCLEDSLRDYKLLLGVMDLTVPDEDDRLIAVPGSYYKVKGMVFHTDSKRVVSFDKEFLADILQKTDLDKVLPLASEICGDVVDHFFGKPDANELEIGAKAGSHGIKGLA